MFKLWPFGRAVFWVLVFILPGLILIVTAMLMGADPLDGMAGGATSNTDLQNSLLQTGYFFLVGALVAAILCLWAIIRYADSDNRYYLFIVLPVLLVLSSFVIF